MKTRRILSLALALALVLGLTCMSAGAIGNPAPTDNGTNIVYTVVRGDNLWKIAERNGLTVAELIAMNPQLKNPSLIYVGDRVIVGKTAAPAENETPAEPEKPADTTPGTETVAPATLVFQNGHIQTLVNENDVAQAVAIRDNTIVYVGDDTGAAAYIGKDTQVVDLNGQFMSPGFMDGHLHGPQPYYEQLFQISIPDGTMNNAEYLRIIKAFVDSHPDLDVYYGGPFMQNAYLQPDGSNPGPQKEDLDAICADKPIMIRDVSHHAMWVNSKALEIAGITKDTPDPDGGVIARNADGEPSGLLTDAAKNMVTAKINVNYTVENMKVAYEAFQNYCLSMGITGLANINLSGEEMVHIEALHQMEQENNLNLRQQFLVWGHAGMGYEGIKAKLDAVKAYASDMIRTGTVKIVYDGVTEGATAVMLEPYTPAAGKGDNWTAASDWTTEEFNRVVAELDKNGYQVHTHAIGDGAVRATLDAYELAEQQNGRRDSRHSMVHVSAIAPEDILRTAKLGVVSDLQFLWMYNDPLCHLESAFVGKDRAMAFYPAKNMLEAGCILSGGSDGAVTAYNPLWEIETGITRNSPFPGEEDTDLYRWREQGLTAYQMLEIYTKNVAYQNFMEEEIGTIEVGKKADLVVLGQNILTCDPKAISETEVVYTISNGKIVFTKA